MAVTTYKDLKQAVINDLRRDDLSDAVIDTIESCIRRYQRDFTFITPLTQTFVLTVGQASYDVPDNLVSIQVMRLNNAGIWQMMTEVEYLLMLLMDTNIPAVTSIPMLWSKYDSKFRVFQAPDKPYTIELTANGKVPIPANDDVSNFWTVQGSDMIRYATEAQLYLTLIKDDASADRCFRASEEHRLSLMRETYEKSTTGVIRAYW